MMDQNFSADRFSDHRQRSLVPHYGVSPALWGAEEVDQRNSAWGLVTALGLSALCWMAMLKLAWMLAG